MMKFRYPALAVVLLVLWANNLTAQAEFLIEPFGTAVYVPEGDQEAAQMLLTNLGNSNLEFELGLTYPAEERQNQGPRRDDFGDRVNFYDYPNRGWCGLAYNGDEIVAADYDNQRIHFWNIEEQDFVGEFDTNFMPWAMAFDGENYWIVCDNPPRIYSFDSQGNQLQQIVLQFTPSGVAWDGENLWTYPYVGDAILRRISPEGEELNRFNCQNLPGSGCYALTWVPEHQDGHLWAISEASILIQFAVDPENDAIELVQQSQLQIAGGTYGITHDQENLWLSNYAAGGQDWGFFVIDDGITEMRWLSFEPAAGLLEPGDEVQIELTFDPEGLEPGVYHLILQIEYTDLQRELTELVEMSMIMSYMEEGATIAGNITDEETGAAIEGCLVELDHYLMSRMSDEDGEYDFEDLPLGDYQFTFSAPDYLPVSLDVELDEPGEFIHDLALLHAECNINEDALNAQLPPDEQAVVAFEVSNPGNGPLSYQVEKRLVGDFEIPPWEIRTQYAVSEIAGDARIQGAVFINDLFYVAGANDQEPLMYVINRDGELIRQFAQVGDLGSYGYKDLAFDGELIWAAGTSTVKALTTNGELVTEFESPFDPANNIAWDPDRELLWVSSTTSDIVGLDLEGNVVANLDRQGLRMYGLAYWPDDPDGYNLYIFHKDSEIADQIVAKMDPESGEMRHVAILEPEDGGSPLSAFITNTFDIYSWVFVSIANAGADDRVEVWQVEVRKDWFELDRSEGVIEADAVQVFELTFDASALPPERYEGELVFSHDGVGRETRIRVTLTVEDDGIAQQTLELNNGWSMVSAHIQPENPDLVELTRSLVEQDLLLLVKNGAGNFYSPAFNFNNIPGWDVAQGYQFKTNAEAELTIAGLAVAPDQPIPLSEGWSLISYYPRVPIDAREAMAGIVDDLLLLKDASGRFYVPGFDFNNMGDLRPGWGYLIKLSADVELIYPIAPQDGFNAENRDFLSPEILPMLRNTGSNMSLLVTADASLEGELGVYAGDLLVGSGLLENGKCGVAVWGDDLTTESLDGALEGAALRVEYWSQSRPREVSVSYLEGSDRYQTDSFSVLNLTATTSTPSPFGLVSAYPNPFNSNTLISYDLPGKADLNIGLYDLSGRLVKQLISGIQNAGQHTFALNNVGLASGVYLVRMEADGQTSQMKVLMVK